MYENTLLVSWVVMVWIEWHYFISHLGQMAVGWLPMKTSPKHGVSEIRTHNLEFLNSSTVIPHGENNAKEHQFDKSYDPCYVATLLLLFFCCYCCCCYHHHHHHHHHHHRHRYYSRWCCCCGCGCFTYVISTISDQTTCQYPYQEDKVWSYFCINRYYT